MSLQKVFGSFARKTARFTGSPSCFIGAVAVVVIWAVSGPVFKFNETWQLVINTGTTIITFLMVFLIQSTQNTDTEALQIKMDELIRAIEGADNKLLALEELDEAALEDQRKRFAQLARKARNETVGRAVDEDCRPGDALSEGD